MGNPQLNDNNQMAYDFEQEKKNVYNIGYYDEEDNFIKVGSYNVKSDIFKFYKASENLLLNPFLLQAIKLLKSEKPQGVGKS
jgi:hypothetical protein